MTYPNLCYRNTSICQVGKLNAKSSVHSECLGNIIGKLFSVFQLYLQKNDFLLEHYVIFSFPIVFTKKGFFLEHYAVGDI